MVIVYGVMGIGQVDVVKKLFSVETGFFHILWLPLLPVGSRVAIDRQAPASIRRLFQEPQGAQGPDGVAGQAVAGQAAPAPAQAGAAAGQSGQGQAQEDKQELYARIPISWKSVLLGYLRGWGFWLTAFCGFFGGMLWLMSLSGTDAEAAAMFPGFLWTAGVAFVVAMGSYYVPWNTASPRRARQLCEAIGLDPDTLPAEPEFKTFGQDDSGDDE